MRAARARAPGRVRTSRGAAIVRTLIVTFVIAWSVAPIYAGLVTSLSRRTDVQAVPAHWIPSPVSLDGYRDVLPGSSGPDSEGPEFMRAMLNSLEIAAAATVIILVLSILSGYAFNRLRFPGRRWVMTAIIGTLVVPLFALIVPLFRIMSTWHLIDTMLGLLILYVTAYAPLGIWLFYNYVSALPSEIEEAGLVDGCNRFQALVRVVIPQMAPGIAALGAILVLSTWGEFLIPLIFATTSETHPLTVTITEFVGKYTTNVPLMMAAGMLSLIPPAVVALVLNRHIRSMLAGWW
jgi:multiple sugar transport system permease protein